MSPWTEDDERDIQNDHAAEARAVPVSAATMLPEAPASANLKLVAPNGIEVMWTLRDTDETALAQRVGAFVQSRMGVSEIVCKRHIPQSGILPSNLIAS
jgi:hypothetical protein